MVLKKARRLPHRLNRPVSDRMRNVAKRRQHRNKKWQKERWKRRSRRLQRVYVSVQKFFVRWLLAAVFISLLVVFGILMFSPAIEVKSITVAPRSNPRLNIEQVQRALSPLFNKHMLFVSRGEATSLLNQAIPDLASVDIDKAYPSEIKVTIELVPLSARLRILEPDEANDPMIGSGTTTDFLTENGVYVSAPLPDDPSLPTIKIVDWGARPVPGSRLLDTDFIHRMQQSETILEQQFGHVVSERTIYYRAQEIHLQLENYALWFDRRSSVEEQMRRYRSFLANVSLEEVTEYVDLRLADRVVFK